MPTGPFGQRRPRPGSSDADEAESPFKSARLPDRPKPPRPLVFRSNPQIGDFPRDDSAEIAGVNRNSRFLWDLIERGEAYYYFTFVQMVRWYMDNYIPDDFWKFYLRTVHEIVMPDGGKHPDSVRADEWWAQQCEMFEMMSGSRGA